MKLNYGISAIALLVGLSACSQNPNPLAVINTPMIKYKTEKVASATSNIPKWYKSLPKQDNSIFSVGSAQSPDLQLSVDMAKSVGEFYEWSNYEYFFKDFYS